MSSFVLDLLTSCSVANLALGQADFIYPILVTVNEE